MVDVNLYEVDDGLSGIWWNRIRMDDLAFFENCTRLANPSNTSDKRVIADGDEDDIFIHKAKLNPSDHFPAIRYHAVLCGDLTQIDKKDAEKLIASRVCAFVKEHHAMPPYCKYIKSTKKGKSVQFKYSPTHFDEYTLKITEEIFETENELEEEFKNLPASPIPSTNAFDDSDCQFDIKNQTPLAFTSAKNNGEQKILVEGTRVIKINKRRFHHQARNNVFYVIQVKGGKVHLDGTVDSYGLDLDIGNIKISDNLFQTSELKEGMIISFVGMIDYSFLLGLVVQNIRTITIN